MSCKRSLIELSQETYSAVSDGIGRLRLRSESVVTHWILSISLLVLTACAGAPPKAPPVKGGTVYQQQQLGPILGPITKEKVLDRMKGYPICGIEAEEQKLTLKVRVFPLNGNRTNDASAVDPKITSKLDRTSLVEIECFFFGYQGLYEFALITPQDGRLYPLSFEGAGPVINQLSTRGQERQVPVSRNVGRSEVCGIPQFDADQRSLKTFCKADPGGGCGAYAVYQLADPSNHAQLDAASAYFKLKSAHFRSCASPEQTPPSQWPKARIP